MYFKIQCCCLDIWHKFSLTVVFWPTSASSPIFTGTSAGNTGGRLCPLHQPVSRLRAADADGTQISVFLHPRNHGRVQRSVTLTPALCYTPKMISFSLLLTPHCWSVFLNWFSVMSVFDLWILCSEMSRARNELQRTPTLMDLYHEMEAMFMKPSAGIWAFFVTDTFKHVTEGGILMYIWIPTLSN